MALLLPVTGTRWHGHTARVGGLSLETDLRNPQYIIVREAAKGGVALCFLLLIDSDMPVI